MADKIRVLIVDDSAVMRQMLRTVLEADPTMEVVGTAADPPLAWDKIRTLRPDVLTLDVEMPRMDGLTFLEQLMREAPMPVVMVSSLTESGCATTLRALELGAIDFVTKPASDVRERLPEWSSGLAEKIQQAFLARPRRAIASLPKRTPAKRPPNVVYSGSMTMIAIGASTGGPEAIREVIAGLPPDCPPVLVVQHMPSRFTRAFADRLNCICPPEVKEAEDGDRVQQGRVLIAPGDFHMRLARVGGDLVVRLSQDLPVNRHRPSVDVLFHSCAEIAARRTIGVLLTGMGEDGARGLRTLRQAGARTFAQDEATSVIFGMPRAAIELQAADVIVPLERVAEAVMACVREK